MSHKQMSVALHACRQCGVARVRVLGTLCAACEGGKSARERLEKMGEDLEAAEKRIPRKGPRAPRRKSSGPTRDSSVSIHPFWIDPRCVKCGGADLLVRWRKGTHSEPERLDYMCKTCAYDWTGDTMDKEAKP